MYLIPGLFVGVCILAGVGVVWNLLSSGHPLGSEYKKEQEELRRDASAWRKQQEADEEED
jgi:hypothetical protein